MPVTYGAKILEELEGSISGISEREVLEMERTILESDRIFCDGLGRSGLNMKAFAMRLMHLGFTAYCVGDVVTPAIEENDLLLICSGSGSSEALLSHAGKAKRQGAKLAVVTANGASQLGQMADVQIVIAAPEKTGGGNRARSILPMASLFEDTSALLFENMVLELMKERSETSESMFARHANLD